MKTLTVLAACLVASSVLVPAALADGFSDRKDRSKCIGMGQIDPNIAVAGLMPGLVTLSNAQKDCFAGIASDLDNVAYFLDKALQQAGQGGGDVASLTQTVNDQKAKIASLETEVTQQEDQIATLKEKVDEIAQKLPQ